MSEYRLVRLGEQIRSEIAQMILRHQIKDPRVSSFLSINRVEVAGDLGYAKVYVSGFISDKEIKKGTEGLNRAAGFIQSTIGKKLTIRQFPKLTFIADSSIKDGFDMVQKLNELEKKENEIREKQLNNSVEDAEK